MALVGPFVCVHGTHHNRTEGLAAIKWAAQEFGGRDLPPGSCWIILYQRWYKANAANLAKQALAEANLELTRGEEVHLLEEWQREHNNENTTSQEE